MKASLRRVKSRAKGPCARNKPPHEGGLIYTLPFVLKYVKLSKYVVEDARNCGK